MSSSPNLKLQCHDCDSLIDVTMVASGAKIVCGECGNSLIVPDKRSTRRIKQSLLRERHEEDCRSASGSLNVIDLGGDGQADESETKSDSTRKDWSEDRKKPGS